MLFSPRNMHLIKINLCAEVAAFFHSMEKISGAMDAEFATGFFIYFLFLAPQW